MNASKAMHTAGDVLMACLVLGLIIFIVKTASGGISIGAERLGKINVELSESDKTMYDGLPAAGSEVINAINKFKNDKLGIIVETNKSTTQYIYALSLSGTTATLGSNISSSVKEAQDIKNSAYINPNGQFQGEVLRDANDAIVGIRFIQS